MAAASAEDEGHAAMLPASSIEWRDAAHFVAETMQLLELERQAEVDEATAYQRSTQLGALEAKGVCLRRMAVVSQSTGLYGRTMLQCARKTAPGEAERSLPAHKFGPGDIVGVNDVEGGVLQQIASGVVTRVSDTRIVLATDELPDLPETALVLTKLADNVTYKRLKSSLEELKSHKGPGSRLVSILFDSTLPTSRPPEAFDPVNTHLNESQRAAIAFALAQSDLAVIHGPPGTGKTTTVVELIVQMVKRGQKVLACAPSNIAVDNLVERLVAAKVRVVRLGHTARLLQSVQQHSLEALVYGSEASELVRDVKKDMDAIQTALSGRGSGSNRFQLKNEYRNLRKELREREAAAVKEVLKSCDVVLGTTTGLSFDGPLQHLSEQHFDVAVVDEAGQAIEAACWLALMRASKCILAGDHLQLPPTIMCDEAARRGLSLTLLERAVKKHPACVRLLDIQYRMNEKIMAWSSAQFYNNRLVADALVRDHKLTGLDGVESSEDTEQPLVFIDTSGCNLEESVAEDNISKANDGEADVVKHHVTQLVRAGVKPADIGVITPYNLQVERLRALLSTEYPAIEIKSVDGFQGREKEAIIMSLVRSNVRGEVGFLSDSRRMNVAVTRARRHLTIVGDSTTISNDKCLSTLVAYLQQHADVRTAFEYAESVHVDMSQNVPSHAQRPPQKPKRDSKPAEEAEEERTQRLLKEFTKKLTKFKERTDGDSTYQFPTSLSSFERMLVHQVCDTLGLQHHSIGEGSQRCIVVQRTTAGAQAQGSEPPASASQPKPETLSAAQAAQEKIEEQGIDDNKDTEDDAVNVDGAEADAAALQPGDGAGKNKKKKKNKKGVMSTLAEGESPDSILEEAKPSVFSLAQRVHVVLEPPAKGSKKAEEAAATAATAAAGPASDVVKCNICRKAVPESNFEIHLVRCEREKRLHDQQQQQKHDAAAKRTGKSAGEGSGSSSGKKQSADAPAPFGFDIPDDMDDDQLLEMAAAASKKCPAKACKQSIATLGLTCPTCKRRFCFSHAQPELHGCGQQTGHAARMQAHVDSARIRDGVIQPGVKPKSLSKDQQERLRNKLQRNISEKSAQRASKPKDKDKK